MIDLSRFDNGRFDRGASKVKELAWWIARSLLFAPWFPVPSVAKTLALRFFGARVGRGVVIRSRVNITMPWRFECGDHVWIGDGVTILCLAPVVLGSHVCVSQEAYLCTGSHDFDSPAFDLIARDIRVGNSCWIAARSFIGPGVRFGDGSRCLAGAVVVKAVVPGQTVAGVPARCLLSQ